MLCIVHIELLEDYVKVDTQDIVGNRFHIIEQVITVFIKDQTIVKHTVKLVNPETCNRSFVRNVWAWRHHNTSDDTSKVTQVEEVVRLCWRRKQILNGRVVDTRSGFDKRSCKFFQLLLKPRLKKKKCVGKGSISSVRKLFG